MTNPSEISEILKQQLESVSGKMAFEEVGTVLEVGDGVAHVYGLEKVKASTVGANSSRSDFAHRTASVSSLAGLRIHFRPPKPQYL